MKKKIYAKAKLIVKVISDKIAKTIMIEGVEDNRISRAWTAKQIHERGIDQTYKDLDELKETLNWNLAGDSSKYRFMWGQSGRITSTGAAYIFE